MSPDGPRSTSRTGDHNYFEDFEVGTTYRHTRGKTVTESDGVTLTNLVMNTAQGHFNEDRMRDSEFGERIVFGGVTLSLVCGIASEDVSENAVRELSYDRVELPNPVFHGTTLYAESEVLATDGDAGGPDAGAVTFRVRGYDQDDETVARVTKTVLLRRRPDGVPDAGSTDPSGEDR